MNNETKFRKTKMLAELSKGGIVSLIVISTFGGYLLGHPFEAPFSWIRLALTLIGLLLLSAGSSAINQIQEHKIDIKMPRTAKRPIPSGKISVLEAAGLAGLLVASGAAVLYYLSSTLFILGCVAVFSYNVLYTLWWKPRLPFAAIPGAIPGALPILMGHVSASGSLKSPGGWYLFALLFFWQMPHFWVLALKYREDYAKGGIPTLPVAFGAKPTVFQIALWCLAYVGVAASAPLFFGVGSGYMITASLTSGYVLYSLWKFVRSMNHEMHLELTTGETPAAKGWIHFFLMINFSLIIYLCAAAADLWSVYLVPFFTQ